MTETMQHVDIRELSDVQPQPAESSTPAKRKRLIGLDAARGVALLGMIAVHALYAYDDAGRPTWSFTIFSGRAAAAFAVLAGVGIAFMTGRQRVRSPVGWATAAALGVRALAVGTIGLMLGYADAELTGVILPYYALMFVLAIPLVFLPTWTIAVTGAVMAAGMPVLSQILLPRLPDPSQENFTLGYLAHHPAEALTELSITGLYPALPWMAYLCAGLVIGRLDLTKTKTAVALLGTGIAFAVAASAASSILLNQYGGLEHLRAALPDSGLTESELTDILTWGGEGTVPTSTWWWLAVDAPHASTPLDLLATTGTAVALIGAMLLIGHLARPALRRLATIVQAPLAAAGRMTLTFYTLHIIFTNSDYDKFEATTGYTVQVIAVLLIGLIGLAWSSRVRGPLEWLVAALATRARKWATPASRR